MAKTTFSIFFKSLFLVASISILSACNSGGGDDVANYEDRNKSSVENTVHTENTETSVGYIDAADIVVTQLWVRDAEGVEQQLLNTSETVKLVPASNDVAEMQVGLEIPPGDYDRVRLVLESGEVILSNDATVADGNTFDTDRGNLKFPSAYQNGIKVKIEPPIKVVSTLSQDLVLSFDLTKSFVFNGPITHAPGVKSVLFKPVIRASNDSTHGRITLNVNGSGGLKCNTDNLALEGVTVTAIDTAGLIPDVTTTTDASGDALFKLLPGNYNILIEATGYESLTLYSKDVYIANETVLENITLGKDRAIEGYNKDIAMLLSIMSKIAYDDGLAGQTRGDDLLIGSNDYPYETSDENPNNVIEQYGACWKFFHYINEDQLTQTQLFIANNTHTGDLVVSFAGTEEDDEQGLGDYIVDAALVKSAWNIRTGEEVAAPLPGQASSTEDELLWAIPQGDYYPAGVHSGFSAATGAIAIELKRALDDAIAGKNKVVTNPASSRIYFTGHSLGGAVATLASLDFVNYLVKQHGYQQNNIFMYSFGAPRSLTDGIAKSLMAAYKSIVPNGYAVAAKDDIVPHIPGSDIAGPLSPYTHIENLVVLSTNIFDIGDVLTDVYAKIGKTRLEHSRGRRLTGCTVLPTRTVGVLTSAYANKGHDVKQYIRRLETSVPEGEGVPKVGIKVVDRGLWGKKLRLDWTGGIRGPCDYVALYEAGKGEQPTNANAHYQIPLGDWQWAIKGDPAINIHYGGYPNSSYETDKNPYIGATMIEESNDFWVGYVDGFDSIINKKCWNCD